MDNRTYEERLREVAPGWYCAIPQWIRLPILVALLWLILGALMLAVAQFVVLLVEVFGG